MQECRVLVVEDDPTQRELLVELLQEEGFNVSSAPSAERALSFFQKKRFDVVVTDVRLEGMSGLELLERLKELDSAVEVIVITAFSSVEDAIKAIKAGAFHYVTKPFEPEVLLNLVAKACQLASLRRPSKECCGIVYASKQMEEVVRQASLFAKSDAPVLITGESGTGKELLARFIHKESGRKGPFIAVNCAAIPKDLFEAELFGYERGAFTGATSSKAGLVEEAEGGTLFLDEVGELPLELQPKLLRFLQEGEFRRVGDTKLRRSNVRIVAATNRDLEGLVSEGLFREDLFYRLSVLNLRVPPLRERPEDVPVLIGHFLEKYSDKYKKEVKLSPEALSLLLSYPYPGNVRELENLIHRIVVLSQGEVTPQLVETLLGSKSSRSSFEVDFSRPLPEQVAQFEKRMIEEALKRTNYVQTKAAKLLGIDEKSLRYKRKKYGI
ncbi:sigma-54-dependent transcriptional regulator [Thermovibrio ammonificans]